MVVVDLEYNGEVDLAQYLAGAAHALQELNLKYGPAKVLIGPSLRRAIQKGHDALVRQRGDAQVLEELAVWRALHAPPLVRGTFANSRQVVCLDQVCEIIQVLSRALDSVEVNGSLNQVAKRRGRPTKIPKEDKIRALTACGKGASYRECARELYRTKYPTPAQRRSAYTVLRNFAKRNPHLERRSADLARAYQRLGVAVGGQGTVPMSGENAEPRLPASSAAK